MTNSGPAACPPRADELGQEVASGDEPSRPGSRVRGGSFGSSPRCAMGPCPHHAVATLRLIVDGYDAVLPVCQSHADWMGAYVEEDADVRLVDRLPEATREPVVRTLPTTRSDATASAGA